MSIFLLLIIYFNPDSTKIKVNVNRFFALKLTHPKYHEKLLLPGDDRRIPSFNGDTFTEKRFHPLPSGINSSIKNNDASSQPGVEKYNFVTQSGDNGESHYLNSGDETNSNHQR